MLRLMSFSTAAVAVLFVTSVANAQSGSRNAAPSVPAFSAPIQSAPAVGGSGTSFGARQTFSQPAPVYSQPAHAVGGSGTVIYSTSPSSVLPNPQPVYSSPQTVYSQPQTVYSQPQVYAPQSSCQSHQTYRSAPIYRARPIYRHAPFARPSCGCGGY